ncbi:MAG: type II secretion system F family protein, partial [Oleibacter sp.]|nr:type II secretion system F family protein [Thalassolituus sp.]
QMERDTTKRMKSATRYPIMVMSSIGVALVVITMFVIPSFSSVFAKLGAELPFATQILIATSNFMEHNWPLVLATTVGSYVGFKLYVSSSAGGILWDKYKLKIPLIGSILERIALSRFSRSFAMMLSSGVPIVNTLSIVAGTIGNRHIGRHVTLMADGIQRGERLTNTAAATGLFTPLVMQMLAVGEETGSIDKLLDQVADFYEREIDYELKKLAESIEPILLVFMGILVLILALGVFLPVWELSGAVSRN